MSLIAGSSSGRRAGSGPAPLTGRLLRHARPRGGAPTRACSAAGARRARRRAPAAQRPASASSPCARGRPLHALAARLRADPRSRTSRSSAAPRCARPGRPGAHHAGGRDRDAAGTPVEWWAFRENFPAAWDVDERRRARWSA